MVREETEVLKQTVIRSTVAPGVVPIEPAVRFQIVILQSSLMKINPRLAPDLGSKIKAQKEIAKEIGS